MVAALGVVMDTTTGKQRFYGGKEVEMTQKRDGEQLEFHRDDIKAIGMSPDRKLVITGQVGNKPSVHIWNAETCEQVSSFLLAKDSRGVSGVSISSCGRYAAAVDENPDHRVYIYNIQRGVMLLQTDGGKDPILDVQWSKRANDLRFVSLTTRQLDFWHPADVTRRLKQKGVFGKSAAADLYCCAFDEEGWAYTGVKGGVVQVWNDKCEVVKTIKVHAESINAIVCSQGKIITGSREGKVGIISAEGGNFKLVKIIDLEQNGVTIPKAIDFYNNNLLVGLRTGQIIEYKDCLATDNLEAHVLMQSHYDGETWGLAQYDDQRIVSCGDDNRIMLFNYDTLQCERTGKVSDKKAKATGKPRVTASVSVTKPEYNKMARGMAVSHKHKHLALSNLYGKVSIRSLDDFNTKICGLKHSDEWNEVMMYSPDE